MLNSWRRVIWPDDRARRFLHVLLLLYLFKQILIAVIMPPFTGHDEVAHYQYIRDVATDFRIPKIVDLQEWRDTQTQADPTVAGDFLDPDLYRWANYVLDWLQQTTINPRTDDRERKPIYAVFYPDYHLPASAEWVSWPNGWVYTANHPPLFYVISAPVYLATDWMSVANQMIVLRMVAIPFGMLAVLGTFLMARWLFPRTGFVAITAAAFVAFQTQISYEAAMINNDILVVGFAAMLMALLVRGMRDRFPWRLTIAIGALFGLMLLSKGSSIAFAGPIAIMMILGLGIRNWREWIPKGAAAAAIGFAMSAPWYIFLYRTYGNFSALDQVADLQYWETYSQGTDLPSLWSDLIWNKGFAVSRWNETWGMFGWRLIPLSMNMMWILGIVCLIPLIAFLIYFATVARRSLRSDGDGTIERPRTWQLCALVAFVLTGILGYAAVIQFGMRFVLTQARYFFPMVPPVAILLMIGLYWLVPERWRGYAQVLTVAALIALNLYVYSSYVVPYWYGGFSLVSS
jgi:4-amino-4-deoxy-L-arabinose transferase-like glycosyltransferase